MHAGNETFVSVVAATGSHCPSRLLWQGRCPQRVFIFEKKHPQTRRFFMPALRRKAGSGRTDRRPRLTAEQGRRDDLGELRRSLLHMQQQEGLPHAQGSRDGASKPAGASGKAGPVGRGYARSPVLGTIRVHSKVNTEMQPLSRCRASWGR